MDFVKILLMGAVAFGLLFLISCAREPTPAERAASGTMVLSPSAKAAVVGDFGGQPIYKQVVDGRECYFMESRTYGVYPVVSISCTERR